MNSRDMTQEYDRNTMLGEQMLLRIFIGERDKYKHIPLYEAIVEFLRKEGFAGATVLRGIAGFGAHSMYHTDRLLRLSTDLPVVIEVIDETPRIEEVIPRLEEMMDGGLITTEQVRVWRYAKKRGA